MATETLEQVFAMTREIVANVKADQLDDPTPCALWDVRRLMNHIVGGSHWFAITTEAGVAPEEDTTEDTDYTAGDVIAAYDEGIRAALAAFRAPGALDRIVKLPFGEFPGVMFMGLATIDHFAHGWDLARATGQPTDLDPALAEHLLAQSRIAVSDDFRGPEGEAPFGPEVTPDEPASPADRLAAFLGRRR